MNAEIAYYCGVWVVAALAGTSRALRNGDFKDLVHLAAVAGMSGFLAFSIVGIFSPRYADDKFNPVLYLGVGALIGLSGREQTEIISALWKRVIGGQNEGHPPTKTTQHDPLDNHHTDDDQ